ncbi:MAG: hypothetical protein QW244_01090 [Candidatus Pacearchaeota archaeon]
MKAQKSFFVIAIAILLLLAGCKKETKSESIDSLVEQCLQACQQALTNNISLEHGPCLLDPIPLSDYVCDIAHWPRQAIDNSRENQCNAWYNKTATHFIELTPECKFIRAL